MTIVYNPVVMPADLAGQSNGNLGPCVMRSVFFPGVGHLSLHTLAANAWEALALRVYAEGLAQGVNGPLLSTTGTYRPFSVQDSEFRRRMTTTRTVYKTDANGNPVYITRTYKGVLYYLKPGMMPVAAPGTSNHGWALANDMAIYVPGAGIRRITSNSVIWGLVQQYAYIYGWSWEGARPGQPGFEAHHIRYVNGDNVPTAVQEHLAFVAAHS